MLRTIAVLAASLSLLASPALAGDKPTKEEVGKVIDYYKTGKDGGPVLFKILPCLKLADKTAPVPNDCAEEVSGPVAKGTKVSAWMLFLVPEGGTYEDVAVQTLHEGVVRSTADLKLTASTRYRTWSSATLSKPGKWTLKVIRGTEELGSIDVVAQ